jgi:hypothetical protein
MRFCTEELKVRTISRFIKAAFGWDRWTQVIGLRADEPSRLAKVRPDAIYPLAVAGVTKPAVLDFWRGSLFDLELAGPWQGNCDGCFLKSRAAIMRMMRDHPDRMRWWSRTEEKGAYPDMENAAMAKFRADREPYGVLAELVRRTPLLPLDETMHDLAEACDGGCGI